MIAVIKRNLSSLDAQNTNDKHSNNLNFFVFQKRMILPKREGGFFPEMEDLPLLEVTDKTGLWYGLIKGFHLAVL